MSNDIFLSHIMQTLLLPPGISIALLILGLIAITRFYTTGKILIILSFALLILFSLPITANILNGLLEPDDILSLKELKQTNAKAIVVLGAGRYKNALEYEKLTDSISSSALTRLSYGVYLHKKSAIPLLLSGGSPRGRLLSEASIMQTALKNMFGLKAKWLDGNSSNTWNNAKFSAQILAKHKIKNIILVTHADHIPRARMAFEHFGLTVTIAPLGFKAKNKDNGYTLLDFLPSARAMNNSSAAMHEFIGYLWYIVRYKYLE